MPAPHYLHTYNLLYTSGAKFRLKENSPVSYEYLISYTSEMCQVRIRFLEHLHIRLLVYN